jgi:GR25 family glycosyltransferase involved in LPS biosynthesis
MVKKLNIYFIHAKFIKEREEVIEKFKKTLKKHKFKDLVLGKFYVISEHDPEAITPEVISKYVKYERITESHVEFYNQLMRNMHVNQLSNTLKHMKAISLIAKNSNDNEVNLVLEDDILYEDKVCFSLEKLVGSLSKSYDVVFLGFPTIDEPTEKSKYLFQETQKLFKVLPFCDSYLVSRSAAKAIAANYTPVKFCNNVQMSYICDKIGITTMQSVPNLFIDGTKYGLFLSKLTPNNPLIFNADFTKLRSIVLKDEYTEQDHQSVKDILQSSTIKNNPDFIHVECVYHMRCKNYEKARERYEIAYKTYMSNGCLISNESVFLKDYIRCHKYLQSDIDIKI